MNKVIIKDGKAILYDDRWVTIGGEDEDGSGQHVLIKENGTIVAGFGTGKNVKNAFSEKSGESKGSAGGAKPEAPKRDYEKEAREAVEYWHKTHYSKETGENIKASVENVRSQMESRLRKAEKNLNEAKRLGKPEIEKEFQDKYDEAKGQLDALNKYYDGGTVKAPKEPRSARSESSERAFNKAKESAKNASFGTNPSPEEEEANRKAKAEIFRQANEESKRKQAEKDRKDKIEARKALKRAEAGLAESKAKGDGKSQSFWEATRNRAENTLGKSSDPERQIKLLERERDRKYDEAETEKEKTKVFNAYKRKIDAIRNPKSKAKEVPISTLRSQQAAIQQRVRGYNNQIAELEKNPTERNKARIQKLQAERDAMEKRGKDVEGRIRSHSDYEKPTSEKPKNVVKVEPNKVTITKSAEGYEGEKSDLLERISDLNWQIASKPGDRMTPYKRQLREDMRKRLREIMEAEKANK